MFVQNYKNLTKISLINGFEILTEKKHHICNTYENYLYNCKKNTKMKKLLLLFVAGIFISGMFFLGSCQKDEEIKALISVKYLADTTEVVPFAKVRFSKYDVNVEGTCDVFGKFEHTFRDEMILDVRAWEVDSLGAEVMYGETTIRLEKGKTVRKSVYIN